MLDYHLSILMLDYVKNLLNKIVHNSVVKIKNNIQTFSINYFKLKILTFKIKLNKIIKTLFV